MTQINNEGNMDVLLFKHIVEIISATNCKFEMEKVDKILMLNVK